MKRLFIKIFSSKPLYFLIITAIILSLNLAPLIADFRHSPAGRTFALIHNNTQDFFFYQSLMNKGLAGDWLTTDPYTTEPHKPSIIFAYFVWMGKIAGILKLPFPVIYHLIRILLSILFIFFVYYFLFFISFPFPRLAFFFFVFAAPFMHRIPGGEKTISVPFMNWWTGIDPIRRAAYLPHHMFGGLFLVISIILIIKYFRKPKIKYFLSSVFVSLLLAFVHTPSLFIILLILPVAVFIHLITSHTRTTLTKFSIRDPLGRFQFSLNFSRRLRDPAEAGQRLKIKNYIGLLGYWVIGLFFLLLMLSQTNRGFPWSQYIFWERKLQFPLDKELIGALGILLPFSIIGLPKTLFSKRFEYILIASWFFIPFFLIPFSPLLNISNIRLIQGVPYLPLSILAVLGINTIVKLGSQLFAKVFHSNKSSIIKNYIGLLPACAGRGYWVIGLLFLFFTLPTLSWSFKDQIKEYWAIYSNVYLDNRLSGAFSFINRNFPKNTRTLSTFYTGNYLPSFTHTISFIGHSGYTYDVEKKEPEVIKFFSGKMPDKEAKAFILNSKITLIFQGPEEKPLYENYLYPNLLKPVYDEEPVTLYRLK